MPRHYTEKVIEALGDKSLSDDDVVDLIVKETGSHPKVVREFVLVERYGWSDVLPVKPMRQRAR